MILPKFDAAFQPLSAQHVALSAKAQAIVHSYAEGTLDHPSYAVIGTFGAGKTQFLFSVFGDSLRQGLLPMYFLAEDLFAEIIKSDVPYMQGDLDNMVIEKIGRASALLCSINGPLGKEQELELKGALCVREASAPLLDATLIALAQRPLSNPKVVVFIDELEVLYRELQRRVQSEGDRSPMREFLERRSILKFISLAPAGIYEMGNADQTRVIRLIIPASDVGYVREHLVKQEGRANAAWWLSRGKARHLFKACAVLRDLPTQLSPAEASRVIHDELDHVGQHPTQVPAAVTDDLQPSKVPFLLNIAPTPAESVRCYRIDNSTEGELADKLSESFGITKNSAMLFAEYFGATSRALSGNDGFTYVTDRDLPDLFSLALDHLLEYEHGNPSLTDHMGELLTLYERFKTEHASVYGGVATIWNHLPSPLQLSLRIDEIRRAFPFPLMNPVVRSHEPRLMVEKLEGKGQPIWRWSSGNITCLFFASPRDFETYTQADEFFSLSIPDGRGLLALIPPGAPPAPSNPLASWLNRHGKLAIAQVPQLLSDFLLSAAGEITTVLPGDLSSHLQRFKEERSDVLLSRKAGIYSDAIEEIVGATLPRPRHFCDQNPPDADNIWGSTQIRDPPVAICGLALAFIDLASEHRLMLVRLRDLFRGGREGRGAGDLNRLVARGGTVSVAEDMLPRSSGAKRAADAPAVTRLQQYWSRQDRDSLSQLARLLPLHQLLKLTNDDDRKRLLEALWRCTQQDFRFDGNLPPLSDVLRHVSRQIVPVVEAAHDLERKAKEDLGVIGLDFGSDEVFVKAHEGFRDLADMIEGAAKQHDTVGSALVHGLLRIFVSSLLVSDHIRSVQSQCANAVQSIDVLKQSAANLVRNFYEFPEAMQFVGISSESILSEYAGEQLKLRQTVNLKVLPTEVAERQERLSQVADQLKRLQGSLQDLRNLLEGDGTGE